MSIQTAFQKILSVGQRNTDCMDSALWFPDDTRKHYDSIIIYITIIIAPCLIHFVICVTGTTALGSVFEKLGFSSSALWLTNNFVKNDRVSCRIKKKKIEIESWPLSAISSVIFSILMSIMFMDYLPVFCSVAQLALSDRPLAAMAR